jgi:hypothetical protein
MIDLDERAAEFVRVAEFNLDEGQAEDLRDMLRLRDGKWSTPTWKVRDPEQSSELVAARALIGLLLLDENVLWTARDRPTLMDAFRRLQEVVKQLEAPVRVRRANGEERIECLDTGKWIRFVCCRYRGAGRGYVADVLIADDRDNLYELVPVMATRPNPQALLLLHPWSKP